MTIGPIDRLRHPTLLAAMLGALQRPIAGNDVVSFEAHLSGFLGDYPQASAATVGLMQVLGQHLGPVGATWRDGTYGLHVADLTAERDRTLQAYTAAIGSLFHDYGITTDQPVTLSVAPSGRLEVDGDHPDAERIQSLLDDSPLLQAAATKVLSLTQALEMMALLQQGQTLHEQDAAAMYQALNLQLSGNAKGWVADVLLEGRLLASSAISHEAAKVDAAIARFDAQHHQHRIEQREQLERWKQDDERRRTLKQEAREADLQDRLAEQAAEKRRQHLHPELGHKPVFI